MSDRETPIGVNDLVVRDETSATPSAVWRSLTEGRLDWWPEMQFEAVAGASLREAWNEAGSEREAVGHVSEIHAGRSLAFHWIESSWSSPLQVRFSTVATTGGARITVRESGFRELAAGDALVAEHIEGWQFHLARLVRYAERDCTARLAR
ncbi:MAG: hypothetical protein JWQ43_493 [Glaciihabitans sp.]|nr:hypothetical protein [Glaciihabitans sp.]